MADGTLFATFVIVFRETLEAGLIVGIILTMLYRMNAMRYVKHIWASVFVAVLASFVVGWALSFATSGIQGQWEKMIEGIISLLACSILTYMVFWMDRQSKRMRPEIETRVKFAVNRRGLLAVVLLPFFAVFREGAETVLYLKAVAIQSSGSISVIGGFLGAGLAVCVTYLMFVGGRKVHLKTLFRATGILLLLIAAGLLAYGIHELQELGWIPMIIYPVWDINHILSDKVGFGAFLKALFGYNGNPALIEVVAYVAYIVTVSLALRRGKPRKIPQSPTKPTPPLNPNSSKTKQPVAA